ncbi:MAG: hypothetical protein V4608_13545 [Bacteroidota bacterium]
MKATIKNRIFVLAICIANITCFAQNKSGVCRLGELSDESLFPSIDSIQLNCSSGDSEKFKNHAREFSSLKCIIIQGDASDNNWKELFNNIRKKTPTVNKIVFDGNTFCILPSDFEKMECIEQLTIKNNEDIDYFVAAQQLENLPNLRELTLDIYSMDDIAGNILQLKNVNKISFVNNEGGFSENDTSSVCSNTQSVKYDYRFIKGGNDFTEVSYTTYSETIDSLEYKLLSDLVNTFNDNEDLSIKKVASTYAPSYNFIQPPIKGLDVDRNFYNICPAIENVLVYPSGTKIRIPANAFVDKEGNPVKENITISYREFRDPVDFLVSGIPMKYDSAGEINHFESAGMFEINASIEKQPLQLANGKQVQMNFATTSVDSTYNFYAFNDSAGRWDYKTKPGTVTSKTKIDLPILSPAFSTFTNYVYQRQRVQDKTPFNKRFESPDYTYTSRVDTSSKKGRFFNYYSEKQFRHKPTASLVKITKVRKNKNGLFFKLRFINDAHPELNEFNNYYFASDENMTASSFKQKFSYKKSFNDIRVYLNGDNCELKLKDSKGFKSVNAHLVTIDDNAKVKSVKNTQIVAKKYNRRLNSRERMFNKKLKKGKIYDDYITLNNNGDIDLYAYEEARKRMSPTEKKMAPEEWLTYNKQIVANQKVLINNASATSNNLIQSLSLDGMGVFNCDQIQRIKQPVEVFATYKNSESEELSPYGAYIIDKKINGILSFEPSNIIFSKSDDAQNILITVNLDGSVGLFKTEDFKKNTFKNKRKFDFAVTEIDAKYTSVSDLKKIIGL